MFSGIASCIWLILMLVIVGYPLWRIVEKAGYPGYMSLLFYIPIVNLIVLWYAAMNPWPLEQRAGGYAGVVVPPPPPPPVV
jgi:hypothetical protein